MMSRPCRVIAMAVALVLAAGPVVAAAPAKAPVKKTAVKAAPKEPCYTRSEHAAEQLLRLHTEMMTVGLYCKELNAADDPFGMYQKFTATNASALSAAERTMQDYYSRHGGRAAFDTYRTELANEISRRSAVINVGVYCHEFVDRVKDAMALNAEQLRTLTTDEGKGGLIQLSAHPLCDVKVVSLPDPPPPPPMAPAPVKTSKGKASAKAATKPVAKTPVKPVKTASK